MGDGEVHVGYRWLDQLNGAHVAEPRGEQFNRTSIGICLVGDFNEARPTREQMKSLQGLVRFLQAYCGIPEENIRLHRDVRDTDCPGRRFPLGELRKDFPRAK